MGESNELLFLGTGTSTGVPEIGCQCPTCRSTDPRDDRLRASALILYKGMHLLIDCGPDFRRQMLTHGVTHLDAILLTHEHYDHVGGVDDIRPLFRESTGCPIYAEPNVREALRTRMPYAFTEHKYPGVPKISLHDVQPYEEITLKRGVKVLPLRVMHGKLPIVGYQVGPLSYITDCKSLPESTIERVYNTPILILNTLRRYPHPAHLCLEEALELITTIRPGVAYLTHFAHTFGKHEDIQRLLPQGVFAAYDGLRVPFP